MPMDVVRIRVPPGHSLTFHFGSADSMAKGSGAGEPVIDMSLALAKSLRDELNRALDTLERGGSHVALSSFEKDGGGES